MKKVFVSLLVGVVLLSLSGCDKGDNTESNTSLVFDEKSKVVSEVSKEEDDVNVDKDGRYIMEQEYLDWVLDNNIELFVGDVEEPPTFGWVHENYIVRLLQGNKRSEDFTGGPIFYNLSYGTYETNEKAIAAFNDKVLTLEDAVIGMYNYEGNTVSYDKSLVGDRHYEKGNNYLLYTHYTTRDEYEAFYCIDNIILSLDVNSSSYIDEALGVFNNLVGVDVKKVY